MTNKAYIVVNEKQEREVLEKLEREGFTWWGGDNPTENMPSKLWNTKFPYTIFVGKNTVTWNRLSKLEDEEIVYDGRKEERMSDKYVVSQEFMNELQGWRYVKKHFIGSIEISTLPDVVKHWRCNGNNKENNNRLITIIRWVNGEDVFEVEKPKKWIVRSKLKDGDGDHWYVSHYKGLTNREFYKEKATIFDTKEEAQEWANSHQEVVEVEE